MARGRNLKPIEPDAEHREDAEALREAIRRRQELYPGEKWGVREIADLWECSIETASRGLNGKKAISRGEYHISKDRGLFIRLPRYETKIHKNALDPLSREELYALVDISPELKMAAEALVEAGLDTDTISKLASALKDRPELVNLILKNSSAVEKIALMLSGSKEGDRLLGELMRKYADSIEK